MPFGRLQRLLLASCYTASRLSSCAVLLLLPHINNGNHEGKHSALPRCHGARSGASEKSAVVAGGAKFGFRKRQQKCTTNRGLVRDCQIGTAVLSEQCRVHH